MPKREKLCVIISMLCMVLGFALRIIGLSYSHLCLDSLVTSSMIIEILAGLVFLISMIKRKSRKAGYALLIIATIIDSLYLVDYMYLDSEMGLTEYLDTFFSSDELIVLIPAAVKISWLLSMMNNDHINKVNLLLSNMVIIGCVAYSLLEWWYMSRYFDDLWRPLYWTGITLLYIGISFHLLCYSIRWIKEAFNIK